MTDTPSVPSETPTCCTNCGSTAFWQAPGGRYLCSRCHPPIGAPAPRTWTVPDTRGGKVREEELHHGVP